MTDRHEGSDREFDASPDDWQREMNIADLLDVAPISKGLFRGKRKIGGTGRIYGGQVVAQALAAASKTVTDDRLVHSLHAYFLRGGSEDHMIDFSVESDFDGAISRTVASSQPSRARFSSTSSPPSRDCPEGTITSWPWRQFRGRNH